MSNIQQITKAPQLSRRSYSANECVGIKVHELLFLTRRTKRELAEALGVTPATAGRKVRGEITWSLDDLYVVADFFKIPLEDLLPRRVQLPDSENAKTPSPERGGFCTW
ncbi:helix-turn-helix transcriptional regulator [Corynebacterium marambiense]|uniref:helix-turn-helix transcriptional regulator n=1 Tax=Corynebacterium marambiense TaxID=2765364 RepID=UPI003610DB99